jgi:hypothetical protein
VSKCVPITVTDMESDNKNNVSKTESSEHGNTPNPWTIELSFDNADLWQ